MVVISTELSYGNLFFVWNPVFPAQTLGAENSLIMVRRWAPEADTSFRYWWGHRFSQLISSQLKSSPFSQYSPYFCDSYGNKCGIFTIMFKYSLSEVGFILRPRLVWSLFCSIVFCPSFPRVENTDSGHHAGLKKKKKIRNEEDSDLIKTKPNLSCFSVRLQITENPKSAASLIVVFIIFCES